MKHRPEKSAPVLHVPVGGEIQKALEAYRARRGFNAEDYVERKVARINEFLTENSLDSAVVAVSGGIDSAVVAHLLDKCDAIQHIEAFSLPAAGTSSATNQETAVTDAEISVAGTRAAFHIFDVSHSLKQWQNATQNDPHLTPSEWSLGQAIPHLRTAYLHAAVNALNSNGHRAVLFGTTNLDEAGYLGFFGKFSEGAVDVQPISDLHKSEVYAVARVLGVPAAIIDRTPRGDMHEPLSDEQMYGAPYDAVELLRPVLNREEEESLTWEFSGQSKELWDVWKENLLSLRNANRHKYSVPSPSVHVDILPAHVQGGAVKRAWEPKPQMVNVSVDPLPRLYAKSVLRSAELFRDGSTCVFPESAKTYSFALLDAEEAAQWLEWFNRQETVRTDNHGSVAGYVDGDRPHSQRVSVYDEGIASDLFSRIGNGFGNITVPERSTMFSAKAGLWRPVGVSPYLRFIQTVRDGILVPHYDEEYVYSDTRQTLLSLVIYLTDTEGTRFITDEKGSVAVSGRDRSDWDRPPKPYEVKFQRRESAGRAEQFAHHILHDSGGQRPDDSRVIVRTDIIYERIGDVR